MSSIISLIPHKTISLIPFGIRDIIPNTEFCVGVCDEGGGDGGLFDAAIVECARGAVKGDSVAGLSFTDGM
jgi:hypothetical protein